jgi:hypothetical protein
VTVARGKEKVLANIRRLN